MDDLLVVRKVSALVVKWEIQKVVMTVGLWVEFDY
jgi:hypothetical protein